MTKNNASNQGVVPLAATAGLFPKLIQAARYGGVGLLLLPQADDELDDFDLPGVRDEAAPEPVEAIRGNSYPHPSGFYRKLCGQRSMGPKAHTVGDQGIPHAGLRDFCFLGNLLEG